MFRVTVINGPRQSGKTTLAQELVAGTGSYWSFDDESVRAIGVRHCIKQCAELLKAGVPGLHFFTFNRPRGPIAIIGALREQQLIAT